jgi:hypothetical protein
MYERAGWGVKEGGVKGAGDRVSVPLQQLFQLQVFSIIMPRKGVRR